MLDDMLVAGIVVNVNGNATQCGDLRGQLVQARIILSRRIKSSPTSQLENTSQKRERDEISMRTAHARMLQTFRY